MDGMLGAIINPYTPAIYRLYTSQAFFLPVGCGSGLAGGVGKSRHATTLSVHASKRLIAAIEARADALGLTKSRFASLVLEKWSTEGCQPVNEPDRLMQIAAKSVTVAAKKK